MAHRGCTRDVLPDGLLSKISPVACAAVASRSGRPPRLALRVMALDFAQGTKSQPIPTQRSKHKDPSVKVCGALTKQCAVKRRWTSAGATPARELDRSTPMGVEVGCFSATKSTVFWGISLRGSPAAPVPLPGVRAIARCRQLRNALCGFGPDGVRIVV